jgi:hypothetical protein
MLPSATALTPDECQRMDAVIHSGIRGLYSTPKPTRQTAPGSALPPVLRIAADEEAVIRELVEDALARSRGD